MADTASAQLNRIVSLVAELTRAEMGGIDPATLDALARHHGVSPGDIARDLRTLTLLGDNADADWLLSLKVWQQDERVSISSAGPFRRPLKLTPEELLAVRIALAMDPEGPAVLEKLERLGEATPPPLAAVDPPVTDVFSLLSDAIDRSGEVELLYAGEGEREARRWVIQPYQLVSWRSRTYLVAWCEAVTGWRHFRADRIIGAALLPATFTRRQDFRPVTDPGALFQASTWDSVQVRYVASAAGLARERHPDCEEGEDGSVTVTLRASSADWLVRRVLEYGEDAEVVGPSRYREAMLDAVA